MRKFAVFDIDGTIFRSSLVISMFQQLVKEGLFPKKAKKEVENSYYAWVNRKGHYDDYIWKIVQLYVQYIKGCREKDIERITNKVIKNEKDKVYRFTRDLIFRLKKKNYFLLAISASPDHIVSEFAKSLSFDSFVGSVYETDGGVFTGKAKSIHTEKKIILKNFIENNNELTKKSSIAVGDTESDIPLFEFVEKPIVFNPTKGLVEIAKKRGWKIIVERKDVIYDLSEFKVIDVV